MKIWSIFKSLSFYANYKTNLIENERRGCLLIMSRRDALKEDFSFGGINILINPFSPSG